MEKVRYKNRDGYYLNKPKNQLSDIEKFNGVSVYLQREYNYPVKDTANSTMFRKVGILVREFLKENDIKYKDGLKPYQVIKNCIYTQHNWKLFKEWCVENVKRIIDEFNISNY